LAPVLFRRIYPLHKVTFYVQLWVGVSSRDKVEYPRLFSIQAEQLPRKGKQQQHANYFNHHGPYSKTIPKKPLWHFAS